MGLYGRSRVKVKSPCSFYRTMIIGMLECDNKFLAVDFTSQLKLIKETNSLNVDE